MLDRPNRSTRKTRRGAAAVELALMLLFLPVLALITVDFARFAYAYVTVTNCARNGAIYAGSNSTNQAQSPYYNANVNTATQSAAQADASNLSPLPTVDNPKYSSTYNGTYAEATGSPPAPPTTGYVKVTVHWTFTTIVTYPGIPSTIDLSRTVTMRLIPN